MVPWLITLLLAVFRVLLEGLTELLRLVEVMTVVLFESETDVI